MLYATDPAIANAIFDAVGVRIDEMPFTPEKILRALKEQGRVREAPARLDATGQGRT